MARTQITATVSVRDLAVLQKLVAIVTEYARHGEGCPLSTLSEGWHKPEPRCRCGLDDALADLLDA